jgi:hypothetical protein
MGGSASEADMMTKRKKTLNYSVKMKRMLLLLGAGMASAATPLSETTATFGSAGKAITLGPGETHLYNHTCAAASKDSTVCVLRHMWFGGAWPTYNITRLRVYVDGEAVASIDGQMDLLHGIGHGDDAAPWASGSLFGKTGSPSGIFNTFQIPFSTSIILTAEPYADATAPTTTGERFWWIARGTEGEPGVEMGGKLLPLSARLVLHTSEDAALAAKAQLPLFHVEKAGAALLTVLSVTSIAEQFLEGEVRAFRADKKNESCSYGVCSYMTMSSGTEDYFLGT